MAKPRTPSAATTKRPAKSAKAAKTKGKGTRQPQPAPEKPAKATASVPAPAPPTHNEIAIKAFEIWIAKGRPIGQDQVNWQEAKEALGG